MTRNLLSESSTPASTARASDAFDLFFRADTLPDILENYQIICDQLCMKPDVFTLFYPKLKANLKSWRCKEIFDKFDARAKHSCYAEALACQNTKVLVIGAGPCGLRTAIEAQFLGAKVVVIEKRNYICRNNVLRLWPFVIEDLCNLGAKRFVRQFCISSLDHVSIKQLQGLLLKVALLLGVEIHTEVAFEKLIEPNGEKATGWRAKLNPIDHPVSKYDFDVIVGADGGRSSFSKDFEQKELRGKLAIAITVNFVNKRTEAETKVPEIGGISYIYNQAFFKKLDTQMGIDLENIIYYKDHTHYFVMTPRKASLLAKGVIKENLFGAALLDPDNVNQKALLRYVKEAVEFSTKYQLPNLEFAANHHGQPDVCMFDFSTMYSAVSSSKAAKRSDRKLLKLLVGDGLLQPFWPTGSGCARGFLSSFDAAWAIKAWSSGVEPLEVLAERESIFKLLAQTTSENLNKNFKTFTLDPCTRYRNLNKAVVSSRQVICLYDTDDNQATDLSLVKCDSTAVRSNTSKSFDVGLVFSSDNPASLNRNKAWDRCQSIAHIAGHNGDNGKYLPKTEGFSNLVSKFETMSSGSLDDKIIWKSSSNVFRPTARRGISTVRSAISNKLTLQKYPKKLEDQHDKHNGSKLEEEKMYRSKPAVAVKRSISIESAKITLKRFRRSNSKDLDKINPHRDVGLNEKEPLPQKRLKRSTDQRLTIKDRKESSFGSSAQYLSRKLAFKRLRDKYEFGNLATDLKKQKAVKKSTRESTRFSGVSNFVSSIFKWEEKEL